ncbi:MAG TPA: DsbA family protein [Candidatus Manganitrophaceae bacterium]
MATPIRIDYYTDPLCSWCFAAEPTLDRVKEHFKDRIELHYKVFPLFDDVREVMNDPARLWTIADRYRIVSKKTGVYIDNKVWSIDPPQSAWPACEAIKAAERQGFSAVDRFIKLLRNGVMLDGKNISRRDVQMELASKAGLDLPRFEKDLSDPKVHDQALADVADARRENVESRPTFILANTQGDKVLIAGPRRFSLFKEAVDALYQEQPEI